MTMGMVRVASLAASAAGLLGAIRTSILRPNKLSHQLRYPLHAPLSPADLQCDRLPFHVTQLSEPLLECPKVAPSCCGSAPATEPTRGIFGGVCAPTASGHAAGAAVALPKNAMKSRRFIALPQLPMEAP